MDGDSGVNSLSNSLNDIAIDFDEKSLSGVSVSYLDYWWEKTFSKSLNLSVKSYKTWIYLCN